MGEGRVDGEGCRAPGITRAKSTRAEAHRRGVQHALTYGMQWLALSIGGAFSVGCEESSGFLFCLQIITISKAASSIGLAFKFGEEIEWLPFVYTHQG
jgi:hypothetical protein